MPKKRTSLQVPKPTTPVHPSLSSSGPAPKSQNVPRSLHSAPSSTGNPVNDLIQRQRLSYASPKPKVAIQSQDPGLGHAQTQTQTQTLPPSVEAVIQGEDDSLHPEPRLRFRISGARTARGPAGPRPPTSWLREGHPPRPEEVQDSSARKHGWWAFGEPDWTPAGDHGWPRHVDPLPGLYVPDERSLLFQTLKSVAIHWDWHMEYNQDGLASLPMKYKERLLYFMARYNYGNVTRAGLEVLFQDDGALENVTAAESLTHLDLATSVGSRCTLDDLMGVFLRQPGDISASNHEPNNVIIPDTWDGPETISIIHHPMPSLSFLTHLSLSHPGQASWASLLRLAPHLTTLTHLSLAFWPTPSLDPRRTYVNCGYGYFDERDVIDGKYEKAAAIMRQLSRATYCLKWLDLTGCCGWIWALQGADWAGSWRGVQMVKAGRDEPLELAMKEGVDWYFANRNISINDLERAAGWGSWQWVLKWLRYVSGLAKLEAQVNKLRTGHPTTRVWPTDIIGNIEALRHMESLHLSTTTTSSSSSHHTSWWDDSSEIPAPAALESGDEPRSEPSTGGGGGGGGGSGGAIGRVVFEASPDDRQHMAALIRMVHSRGETFDSLDDSWRYHQGAIP